MNNTTTTLAAIIVLIFTAAILVVGGTLAATPLTIHPAFAYKKKDGNNNGNTVTIQKCKQLASESGFDNTQEQECENLICTHPGNNATCSQEGAVVTPTTTTPEPKPTTGTLLVKKVVECVVGTPCPAASDFSIVVTGNNPTPSSFKGSVSGTLVTLGPGTYTVTETERPSEFFSPHFSGDCKVQPNDSASGTISANEHQTCTITNFNGIIP
jgi:hypothetical protein